MFLLWSKFFIIYCFLLFPFLLLSAQDTLIRWEPERQLTYDIIDKISCSITAQDSFVHILFNDGRLMYMRSSDYGNTWSDAFQINQDGPIYTQCIKTSWSNVFVTWMSWTTTENFHIKFRKSADFGLTWQPEMKIKKLRGLGFACLSDTLFVVGSVDPNMEPPPKGLYLIRSFNAGDTWSDYIQIADSIRATQGNPAVHYKDGILHLAFVRISGTGPSDPPFLYYTRSTDLGLTWSSCAALSDSIWPYAPRICGGPQSYVFVNWIDSKYSPINRGDLFFRRTSNNGLSWDTLMMLTNDHVSDAGPGQDIASNKSDVYCVWCYSWGSTHDSLFFIASTDSGRTWFRRECVRKSRGGFAGANISTANAKLHVLWTDGDTGYPRPLYYRRGTRLETGIEEPLQSTQKISLVNIQPNPFKKSCSILLSVVGLEQGINIRIYDIIGKEVMSFRDKKQTIIKWDGRDFNSKILPSGVYFIRIYNGRFSVVKKIVLSR